MQSIKFPNMLGNQRTNIVEDHDATYQNLRCLLLSNKMSMLGDPFYGTNIKNMLYSQTRVLSDILKDDIYNAIRMFMPQLTLDRKDIKLYIYKDNLYVKMTVTNWVDQETNLYDISLTEL